MSSQQTILHAMKRWLSRHAAQAIGYALMVALLVSNGQLIQTTLLALFDVSKLNWYESIFSDSIKLDQGPKSWLLTAFQLPWLATGIVAGIVASHFDRWRQKVFAISFTVAVALMAVDIISGTIYGTITTDDMIVNLLVNTLGGLCIGLVLFVTLWASHFVCKAVAPHDKFHLLITAIMSVVIGLGGSLAMYLSMATILQPGEVKVRLIARPPIHGQLGVIPFRRNGGQLHNILRFTNEHTTVSDLVVSSTTGLNWQWTLAAEDTEFMVTVYAVKDCFELEQAKELTSGRPIIRAENVRKLGVNIDGIVGDTSLEGRFTELGVSRREHTVFGIEESDDEGKLILTELVPPGGNILARTIGNLSLFVPVATIESEKSNSGIPLSSRFFRLQIDEQESTVAVVPVESLGDNRRLNCSYVDELKQSSMGFVIDDMAFAGLYVEILQTEWPTGHLPKFDGEIEFRLAEGAALGRDVSSNEFGAMANMELSLVVIQSQLLELFVNGVPYKVPTGAEFRGGGNAKASYKESIGLTLSGTFQNAWLGGQRLNLTRWETWTVGSKIKVILVVVSFFVGVATLIFRTRILWKGMV